MKINIEKLNSVSFLNKLGYAYVMCMRSHLDYVYFSNSFSFGNVIISQKAIDDIHKHLVGLFVSTEEVLQDFNDLSINTPDTDDFATIHASDALDACSTILNALQFILDKNFDHLKYISRYGTDKVDRHIIENIREDAITPEFEKFIANHPLMKNEISKQNEMIQFLVSKPILTELDLDYLIAQLK
jgi:uncharacterized protein YjaG (DUF416 family)